MRPTLCLPTDVLRKWDPQVTESALRNFQEGVSPIGNDDYEKIVSRIEGVESRLERETGNPYRLRYVGDPDDYQTWEVPSRYQVKKAPFGRLWISLNKDQIVDVNAVRVRDQFDFEQSDTIERDNLDINYQNGTINVRRSVIPTQLWEIIEHKGFHCTVSYTYGALGGNTGRAGQTETTAQISETDTSVTVENGSRLPPGGGTLLIGQEYVSTERNGDTLELTRGVRGTDAKAHDAGTGVHYCPMHIREAVAAKAAIELSTYVDKIDEAVGAQFDPQEKKDVWNSEWESVIETSGEFVSL